MDGNLELLCSQEETHTENAMTKGNGENYKQPSDVMDKLKEEGTQLTEILEIAAPKLSFDELQKRWALFRREDVEMINRFPDRSNVSSIDCESVRSESDKQKAFETIFRRVYTLPADRQAQVSADKSKGTWMEFFSLQVNSSPDYEPLGIARYEDRFVLCRGNETNAEKYKFLRSLIGAEGDRDRQSIIVLIHRTGMPEPEYS